MPTSTKRSRNRVGSTPTQIELMSAIVALFPAGTVMNTRQFNAIISASSAISLEFSRPTVRASNGMGLKAWLASDDTGSSSLFMAAGLFSADVPEAGRHRQQKQHPLDPDDFGRCYRFIDAVPGARERLQELADIGGRVWAALISVWTELETLYIAELEGRSPPRLYSRMQELIRSVERAG